MATFFGKTFFFENWDGYSGQISCGSKILSKLLYLARLLRYKHFCVLQIQNNCHFWRDKNFWKNLLVNLQRYPVGQKFNQNRSISHSFFEIEAFFMFCNFYEKFENSKWPPFLARQ